CIVPVHAPGTIITMPRNTIDYIVTEYGIAELKGKDVRTRINNLIAVAHPDHRDELRFAADKFMI
ncbi:MAG: 4-hydroxybutyrate--acetyl-CoA CoA transferase, partial [Lachnospiraceae bacterium]|nr:4-hydroxybutyrate--acetyl-CoA CoA transferase [Lachnospiraceae bacterium]